MGYRSDVCAVFYAAEEKDFPVIKLWLMENFPMEMFEENISWFNRGIIVKDDHVKWYDDYPEVKAFDEAVFKFREMFCSNVEGAVVGAYEYVRLGENYDDIETKYHGSCDYILDVQRSIEINMKG